MKVMKHLTCGEDSSIPQHMKDVNHLLYVIHNDVRAILNEYIASPQQHTVVCSLGITQIFM